MSISCVACFPKYEHTAGYWQNLHSYTRKAKRAAAPTQIETSTWCEVHGKTTPPHVRPRTTDVELATTIRFPLHNEARVLISTACVQQRKETHIQSIRLSFSLNEPSGVRSFKNTKTRTAETPERGRFISVETARDQ